MTDSNRADRLVKKHILSLNRHIPKQRKTLEEDRPHVVAPNGTRHRFKTEELQRISDIVPESEHHLLKLPIYLEIESVTSGARVTGNIETKVVCSILNMEGCSREIFIYRPDIRVLRARFPTTTQYIFLVR
jgi:hypothetical protein